MGIKKALAQSLDVIAPDIEERTTLIIDLPYDENVYTYAAIFVNRQWYLTGNSNLIGKQYPSTIALLTALGNYQGAKVSLVTETEVVR